MRKIKQMLMTIAVLLCSATANAYDFEVDGIYYNILSASDLTVEVTCLGTWSNENSYNDYRGDIIIPSTVTYKSKVLTVTRIGAGAFQNSKIKSISIPSSVTEIFGYAFRNCKEFEKVRLEDGTETLFLSEGVFSNISSIYLGRNISVGGPVFGSRLDLEIGNCVTRIEANTFSGCSIYSVYISDLSAWCNIDFHSYPLSPSTRGGLYLNGEKVTDLVIPNNVTSIGNGTFYNCACLTSVVIPNSVTSIGKEAFYGCNGLTSVVIPNSVTSIGEEAFYGCDELTSIKVPNSVTSIGEGAFEECSHLRRVELDCSEVKNWFLDDYGHVDNNTSIEEFVFGNNVKNIKLDFGFFEKLTNIHFLGETPPTIGSDNFEETQYMDVILYVPVGALGTYQAADVWKNFWDIREEGKENPNVEVKKCATPTISYEGGKLNITSETEGVEFVTEITNSDITKHYTSMIELAVTYNVSTYAKLSGYENSDVTYATLCWIESDDARSDLTQIKSTPVLIKSNEGSISISGVKANTEITVYDINGNKVSAAVADGNEVVINTSLSKNDTAIIHIGDKVIKIIMR